MPPALHPKSTQTLSLFTTTLVLSFGVVTLPHVFPCPVDHRRRMYADGQRRRRSPEDSTNSTVNDAAAAAAAAVVEKTDLFTRESNKRECPVPKPTGFIGNLLGFKNTQDKPQTVIKVEVAKPDEKR